MTVFRKDNSQQWPNIPLRHLFNVTSGATPASGDETHWNGSIPWVTPEDVGSLQGVRLNDTRRKITQEGYNSCGTRLASKDSIVLTKRAPIGQLAILDIEACSNQGCFLLTPYEAVYSRFYYYLLLSKVDVLQVYGRGSTFLELSTDDLKSLSVAFPKVSEQTAIADFLDREIARIDTLLTAKVNHLVLVSEKRRALITSAAIHGINTSVQFKDSGIPWLGEIPEHWPLFRAKYLWRECSLPVRDGDEMVTCFRDGQVTLRKNRREDGFTNSFKELGYQGVRAGQLVLHSMDAFAGAIGVSDSEGKCTPEYIICDPVREDVYNPYYGYLLRIMAINGFVQATCTAVRERAPRIHFSDFGNMFFPVPPLEEQRAIVDHIVTETGKLDALRTATEKTIGLLKERRAALISAAVTGKISNYSV